jgi:hypothetical protein
MNWATLFFSFKKHNFPQAIVIILKKIKSYNIINNDIIWTNQVYNPTFTFFFLLKYIFRTWILFLYKKNKILAT